MYEATTRQSTPASARHCSTALLSQGWGWPDGGPGPSGDHKFSKTYKSASISLKTVAIGMPGKLDMFAGETPPKKGKGKVLFSLDRFLNDAMTVSPSPIRRQLQNQCHCLLFTVSLMEDSNDNTGWGGAFFQMTPSCLGRGGANCFW